MVKNKLREALSDISHDIWTHWMFYMFSTGTFKEDGTWVMPAEKVQRWKRQMDTSYPNLPENEKEGDREQADKILDILGKAIAKND